MDLFNNHVAFELNLRSIEVTDEPFLLALFLYCRPDLQYISNLNDENKDLLIKQQFYNRNTEIQKEYPKALLYIVTIENKQIGQFYIQRDIDNIHLIEIGLIPEFRGLGIGSRVIKDLLKEANINNQIVSLKVMWYNIRAKNLYLKLGFKIIEDTGIFCSMKWHPN